MLIGLFLILMGVLVLVEPKILVLLLGCSLITGGTVLVLLSWKFRRMMRRGGQMNNRWTQFMVRF